jgi:2-isopropylmalate synthase
MYESMENDIFIFDTTLRDGEQVPGCQLNTDEKIEIARMLEDLGVDIIEAGFPVSSPGDFQSVFEISKAVSKPIICALTRARQSDIDCAAEALKPAKRKRIHTGIGSSDIHILHKFKSTRAQVLEQAVASVKYAKTKCEDIEFYAEDAGRADIHFLCQLVTEVIKAGATVINLPDTTGYCLPEEYGGMIRHIRDHVKDIDRVILSCHCHDDLGLATANALAGIRNGVRQVECTVNGIGERAGNSSLEEMVMILKSRPDLNYRTHINAALLCHASSLVSSLMNMPVQANKAIVGKNAFSHSSGIHQDGFLKHAGTYEIINPETVGAGASRIILSARSGRAALGHHLLLLGYEHSKEELTQAYTHFVSLADRVKNITDSDLHRLMEELKAIEK